MSCHKNKLKHIPFLVFTLLVSACSAGGNTNLRLQRHSGSKETNKVKGALQDSIVETSSIKSIDGQVKAVVKDARGVETVLAPQRMLRLTKSQIENSLSDIFVPITFENVKFDDDDPNNVFESASARGILTSSSGADRIWGGAFQAAELIVKRRGELPFLKDCTFDNPADACIGSALNLLADRLWRRSLNSDEKKAFQALVSLAKSRNAPQGQALTYSLQAFLASPSFHYATLSDRPVFGAAKAVPLPSLSVATKLSLFLTDSLPDKELVEASKNGTLETSQGIKVQMNRLLATTRGKQLAKRFFNQAWNVRLLQTQSKSEKTFPDWNASLYAQAISEFERFLEDVSVTRKADLREVFTGRKSYLGSELAKFYGVSVGAAGGSVEIPADRSGLITSVAVLAANSRSDGTSPTKRGVFLLERVLCQNVPMAPDNVMLSLPEATKSGLSERQRLELHRTNATCAACHKVFDPLGLSLEVFDGIGRQRTMDGSEQITTSLNFADKTYPKFRNFAEGLEKNPQVTECFAKNMLSFSTGVVEHALAKNHIQMGSDLVLAGGSFGKLVELTAISPYFLYYSSEPN
jgi:Protein of unknown function (DUF1592)/Protein of unknown function (DUF1588)